MQLAEKYHNVFQVVCCCCGRGGKQLLSRSGAMRAAKRDGFEYIGASDLDERWLCPECLRHRREESPTEKNGRTAEPVKKS